METHQVTPVSIIIPTLNEEHYLPILLESLTRLIAELDVVVVDGGSTDATLSVGEKFISRFPTPSSLRILSSPRGLSLQRNSGAAVAKHELLLFLDADVVIPSNETFQKLVTSFIESRCAAGVAHLAPLEGTVRGHIAYFFFDLTQRICLWFHKPYLGTFCLITTKEVFNAIRGFDITKPVTEDIDFCFKAKQIGRVIQLPLSIPVSERRFQKYGYFNVFRIYVTQGWIFLTTGSVRLRKDTYPFGEY